MAVTFLFIIWQLLSLSSIVEACQNYWQSINDGASSTRRPFDVCYRSYRDSVGGDYSYRYICNDTFVNDNVTVNGFTVFKQFYDGVSCLGTPNATVLEDTLPFAIYCGGIDCDLVRYRVYDIENNDVCNADNYPNNILAANSSINYRENVHVIERCDDDGFVSDSYFCSADYFYINSYNNDKCRNEGIYSAQYYFNGCNDDNEYIEVVECGKDSGLNNGANANDSGLEIWGIIFIVLALVAVLCGIVFVIYHCKKKGQVYDGSQ